jgi:chromosomal replication initiation ATPase DnaA
MGASEIANRLRERGLDELAEEVCARRGVVPREVYEKKRGTQSISHARHELWWQIRHHPGRAYSFPDIAALFDRTHTTIMAGVQAHERRRKRVRVKL